MGFNAAVILLSLSLVCFQTFIDGRAVDSKEYAEYLEALESGTFRGPYPSEDEEDLMNVDSFEAQLEREAANDDEQPREQGTVFEKIVKINEENVPDVKKFHQVDIRTTDDFGAEKRNAVKNRRRLWSTKVIPYKINPALARHTRVIKDSLADFERRTCIRFVERSDAQNGIEFIRDGGCYSYIGQIRTAPGSYQPVSIGEGCQFKAVIIHEVMHAIGFYHEQSRYDRDQYVKVNLDNVIAGTENNFRKESRDAIDTLDLPYDYDGVMHYGRFAFSKNGLPTIEAIGDRNRQLGNRVGFSDIDVAQINKLYNCPAATAEPVTTASTTKSTTEVKTTAVPTTEAKTTTVPTTEAKTTAVPTTEAKTTTMPTTEAKTTAEPTSEPQTTPEPTTEAKTTTAPPPVTTKEPTTTSSPLTTSAPVIGSNGSLSCDFEKDLCNWKRDTSRQLQWRRLETSTRRRLAGPAADHTTGLGHFLRIIKRFSRGISTGSLVSPQVDLQGNVSCLELYYNMFRNRRGTLMITAENMDNGFRSVIYQVAERTNRSWRRLAVNVDPSAIGRNVRVYIDFVVHYWGYSLAAIDNIKFSSGKCQEARPLPSTNALECPFSTGFCSWGQVKDDKIDWKIGKEGSDMFAYLPKEGSDSNAWKGQFGMLQSPLVFEDQPTCMQLRLRMKERMTGDFRVYVLYARNGRSYLEARVRNGGAKTFMSVDVNLPAKQEFYVRILGENGMSPDAIQMKDITVSNGFCPFRIQK